MDSPPRCRRPALALTLVLATTMVACAQSDTTGARATDEPSVTATAPTSATSATASRTDVPTTSIDGEDSPMDHALTSAFRFRRTGGIAGIEEELTVEPDGDGTITRGGTSKPTTVAPDDLAQLATALDELDWDAVRSIANEPATVDDDYQLLLSYGDQEVAVGASQLPRPAPAVIVVAQDLLGLPD